MRSYANVVLPAPIAALLWLIPNLAQAQESNALAHASYQWIPATGVENPDASAPDLEIEVSTIRAGVKVPFVTKGGRTVVLPGVAYSLTRAALSNTPADDPDAFHELSVELAILHRISKRWSVVGRIAPGLATTFDDVDSDHVRFQTSILAIRGHYGFGLSASYIFGQLLPIPLVQFDWQATPAIRVRGILPSHIRAGYTFANRVEVGVVAQVNGNRYSITDANQPIADSVKYSVGDAAAFVRVRLHSMIWLSGSGGATLFRKFDVRDSDDNRVAKTDVDPAPVIQIGLELTPPRQQR